MVDSGSETLIRYQVPGARCQRIGTLRFHRIKPHFRLSGTWHLAPGTWHLAPGTWYLAPEIHSISLIPEPRKKYTIAPTSPTTAVRKNGAL
jgi:hypothetical protein